MRVMLVDDEADLASALAERLEMRGINADWATDGQKAFDLAKSQHYDIAVLDVKMPKIGGLELRGKLHALYPDMKFIFLTGYGSEVDFKKVAGDTGEACYLVKPVDIQDLIQLMNSLTTSKGGA